MTASVLEPTFTTTLEKCLEYSFPGGHRPLHECQRPVRDFNVNEARRTAPPGAVVIYFYSIEVTRDEIGNIVHRSKPLGPIQRHGVAVSEQEDRA